jgi:hypothetical protein
MEIPILIRSLAACMLAPPASVLGRLELSFEILKVLDAGTLPRDPSSLVREYAYQWWTGNDLPPVSFILTRRTLQECLEFHRQFRQFVPPITLYEKHSYMWGRALRMNEDDCENCPKMRAYATAVWDELRELRVLVDGMETCLDVRREDIHRRAAMFHTLMGAAELKQTEPGSVVIDSETDNHFVVPKGSQQVAGTIRRPRRGREAAKVVQERGEDDLVASVSQPNVKWTWGVDLEVEDLRDQMGARYNQELEGSHSGYDSDLTHGSFSGEFSPIPSGNFDEQEIFDHLSADYVDPLPELATEEIPSILQLYPLRLTDPVGTELAAIMEKRFQKSRRRSGRPKIHLVERPKTPDLTITSFNVPRADPVVHRAGSSSLVVSPIRHLKNMIAPRDPFTTPSAERYSRDITMSVNPHRIIEWNASPPSAEANVDPSSSISARLIDLVASRTPPTSHRRRQNIIWSDDDMEVDSDEGNIPPAPPKVIHEPGPLGTTVDAMAEAWNSPILSPASMIAIDSPHEDRPTIDVSSLAAVWDDDKDPQAAPTVVVGDLLASWGHSDDEKAPNQLAQLTTLWDSGDEGTTHVSIQPSGTSGADATDPSATATRGLVDQASEDISGSESPSASQPGTLFSKLVGLYDSDDGPITGPYTPASFSNVPSEWLDQL